HEGGGKHGPSRANGAWNAAEHRSLPRTGCGRGDDTMTTGTAAATTRAASQAQAGVIATDIPARLDRLRWGRFHTLVVVALGITWILDGLEVTLAGAISPALKESHQLQFSNAEVGL